MALSQNYNNYSNGTSNNFDPKKLERSNLGPRKDDIIDLRHHAYLLWDHKWIVIITALMCLFIAWLLAALQTPIYQSSGSLMITESKNQYSYAGSDLGNLLTNSYGIGLGSSIIDELQILRSRKLSEEVADTLINKRVLQNGKQYPVVFLNYPEDSTIAPLKTVASRLRSNLIFTQVDIKSNLINISYQSSSPVEAAEIVNMTINTYSKVSTRQNRRSANAAVDFLSNERKRIEGELNLAEVRLQDYMNNNELVQVDVQTESVIERIADLEEKRQQAKTNLVTVNSALKQYQDQLNSIKPGLADQFADAIGPKMERLQYRLAELSTERTRLLSENPQLANAQNSSERLQKLNQQISNYQQEIRSLTNKLVEESDQYLGLINSGNNIVQDIGNLNKKIVELKIEQQQYESQENVLTEEINKLDEVFDNLPANMMGLARLKRSVEINEKLYLTVSEQYAEMSLWQQTQFGQGQLVDEGFIPSSPIEPNTQFYLLIGFIVGLIISIGYIFIQDSYDTTIDAVHKLKQIGVPVLAIIPNIKEFLKEEHKGENIIKVQGRKISTGLISFLDTISPAAESFRRLESNIMHSNPDSKLRSLLVTSTTKGEGKTFVAANLAVVMAESDQKIILVDTDLRRPQLHHVFGLEQSPGIMDVLFENATLEEAIRPSLVPNLSVLCSGKRPTNASAIVKSKSFLNLIKKLETSYDMVLIDTPPFGIITDSSTLMDQSDGVIVVSRFGETQIVELGHTIDQLHRIDAQIYGTVLNGFDSDRSTDYYYGTNYYNKFYEDYSSYSATDI